MPSTDIIRSHLVATGQAEDEAAAWIARMPADYCAAFGLDTIRDHIAAFRAFSPENPVFITVLQTEEPYTELHILSPDYTGMLATVAGSLTGLGVDIHSGDTYTLGARPAPAVRKGPIARHRLRASEKPPLQDRKLMVARLRVTCVESLTSSRETVFAVLGDRLRKFIAWREADKREEVRSALNHAVADRLSLSRPSRLAALSPVELDIDDESDPLRTRLTIIGQDTPAFLYAIANALSLRRFNIDRVHIETHGTTAGDTIWLMDEQGTKPTGAGRLRELRIAALLTKQFTHFLPEAPDPYMALSHFDQLIDRVLADGTGDPLELFRNPDAMARLAHLLGASAFLWEDFIRRQYDSILPALAASQEDLPPVSSRFPELDAELARLQAPSQCYEAINRFKDRETARTDMAHILQPNFSFARLSEDLSDIAEGVVRRVTAVAYAELVARYGHPRVIGGAPCPYCVVGQGKLGGRELGYASDLELLLVYSDHGRTAGGESIDNASFFNQLVEALRTNIRAPRDGIYHIDLRLRPHGDAGPLAASLESILSYYTPGGGALDYERLALTRLRPIAGDEAFGQSLMALRDELIYTGRSIDFEAVKELRRKQFEHKGAGERINAKFSAGGLVDIEYAVQMLQVEFGGQLPEVRCTGTLSALQALERNARIDSAEFQELSLAYRFLRTLINSLRMLRGHAMDLEIPAHDSAEFGHLARRMGYGAAGAYSTAELLRADIERHMAVTRTFYRRHFGEAARLIRTQANLADLVLADDIPDDTASAVLSQLGLTNIARARANLKSLAGFGAERAALARLAVLFRNILPQNPDPDMALNNVDHFAESVTSRLSLYQMLLEQPRRLDLLFRIAGTSNYLSHTLCRSPELFDWLSDPTVLEAPYPRERLAAELRNELKPLHKKESRLRMLRRFRNRQTLRIGVRDLCLGAPFHETVEELSNLADELIWASFEIERQMPGTDAAPALPVSPDDYVLFAFGKLGGRELNYSSDIDLVAVYRGAQCEAEREDMLARLTEGIIRNLDRNIDEGYVYRIDMRLRPHGRTAPLVTSEQGWLEYYRRDAALWELQAVIKARPVAGNIALGEAMLATARMRLRERTDRAGLSQGVEYLRNIVIDGLARARAAHPSRRGIEVKNGSGGIRDIEFGVQLLQRIHAPDVPDVVSPNTVDALSRLAAAHVLDAAEREQLERDYVFLRRVEHLLQIMDDQQLHILRETPQTIAAVARRMPGAPTPEAFRAELDAAISRNRAFFQHVLHPETTQGS